MNHAEVALLLMVISAAMLVVALFLAIDIHVRLRRVESALRDRNETLMKALSATGRHVRAISETSKPGSRLSVARNWPEVGR